VDGRGPWAPPKSGTACSVGKLSAITNGQPSRHCLKEELLLVNNITNFHVSKGVILFSISLHKINMNFINLLEN